MNVASSYAQRLRTNGPAGKALQSAHGFSRARAGEGPPKGIWGKEGFHRFLSKFAIKLAWRPPKHAVKR